MLSLGLGLGVALAVVICVAVLVAIALLGLRRYGVALPAFLKSGGGEEKQEMEWDNCELNITVNPLDVEGGFEEDAEMYCTEEKNITYDVIEEQEQSDEEDQKEEEKPVPESKELEWDDSTLTY